MKPIIGITIGDPAGIGPEITVKALSNDRIYDICVPVVIGDYEALDKVQKILKKEIDINQINSINDVKSKYGVIDLINLNLLTSNSYQYKSVQLITGDASFKYVIKGINLAVNNDIHAVVTGPINKEAINLAGYHYSGHTEIFAEYTNTKNYAMLLTGGNIKVIHATTHCSMREACDKITKQRIFEVIKLAQEGLNLMGLKKPRIGVAGLNAHAGENGLFGWEEAREITPAIEQAQAMGIIVEGPIPPDTVFVKCQANQYDVVVAMYHDQGHIPLKLAGFKLDLATNRYVSMSGVNITVGLPIIRTSVDHGTAFGKAGEGRANEESLVEALDMAVVMAKNKFNL
ncbi:MAG: 4-hydroxythreonine-4-phosphate dehydrogenase PdxA [Deltaproteobacteria bacterium]|jgi:4-hydroxythreonine-4-phosphate dehydrogenase|nr:4-hydroxythreonine-4-phosphate dehydrogenase PdxA [Deltaproteobacteria bacterium]